MKRYYPILLAALMYAGVSCQRGDSAPQPDTSKEVEIEISTAPQQSKSTRAPLDGQDKDTGDAKERIVNTLDLLVFSAGDEFLYRREAVKLSSDENTFRALLVESEETLTVHLFANCQALLRTWEAGGTRTGLSWETVHGQLADAQPERLVNSGDFQPLPMWGTLKDKISSTSSPTKWGPVSMLRSVASIDLFVEQNTKTADFVLTDLFAYFAANKGFVGAIEKSSATPPKQYLVPADMATSLNAVEGTRMQATGKKQYTVVENSETLTYDGIAYQMYIYENEYLNTSNGDAKRPTRAIVAGYYKQTGDPADWEKSYYPVDLVYDNGQYRPVIRNWKYEFKVTAVNGPGYPSLEEAARGATSDLNVNIISWNKDDVQIGVKGHYYVTMESKEVYLWRYRDDFKKLNLSYEVKDDDPAQFTIHFKDDSNGDETAVTNGIENDWFRVVMNQTPGTGGGTVEFTVTALQDYDKDHCEEFVKVKFRDLEFTVYITQLDSSEEDWDDGGDIPTDL